MEYKKLIWTQMDQRSLSILKDGVRLSIYDKKVMRACERLHEKIKPLEKGADKHDLNDINTLTALSVLAEAYDQTGVIDVSYELIRGSAEIIKKQLSEILRKTVFTPDMAQSDRDKLRRVYRQKLWCLMIKCHGDYRKGNYNEGLEALNICEHVIFNVLKDDNPDDPYKLRGTRARLFYFKGLILSEQGDWSKARLCFEEAQFSASERLEDKLRSFKNKETRKEAIKKLKYVLENASEMDEAELKMELEEREITYFRHCRGKLNCFGFARIQRSLGQLRQARHNLRTARLDLANTKNSNMLDLVDLELGITLRALTGYDVEQLREPVETLERCSQHFYERQQEHYYIRSLIALGGTYLARARAYRMRKKSEDQDAYLSKAAETAKKADDKSKDFKGWYWRTKLLLGRVELERGRSDCEKQNYAEARDHLQEAENYAQLAYDAANPVDFDNKEPQKKMEVLKEEMLKGKFESKIALGEIYLERADIFQKQMEGISDTSGPKRRSKKGESVNILRDDRTRESTIYLTKARDTFEEVRKMSNNMPIYDTICSINLCRTYMVWNLYSDAKRELEKWKSYENQIENQTIRDIGKQVESQFHKTLQDVGSGPLIFKSESTELNYKKLKEELLEWLIKQARIKLKQNKKSISQANIAKELGLSSRTALYRWSEGKNKAKGGSTKNKTRS